MAKLIQGDIVDGQGTGHVSIGALPDLALVSSAMSLFDPSVHLSDAYEVILPSFEQMSLQFEQPTADGIGGIGTLPPLPLARAARFNKDKILIPRVEDCYLLWDRYKVPGHIRLHSKRVADLAYAIVCLAHDQGFTTPPAAAMAAGLLHDIAKGYCVLYGGNHSQVGASWVMRETRNGPIARAVLFHVSWPWVEALDSESLLAMSVIYADKRVRHDGYVSIEERYSDLMERYGVNSEAIDKLHLAKAQGKRIEALLSKSLGENLDEYIVDSGRLVKRA